jgi:hypothetical protein
MYIAVFGAHCIMRLVLATGYVSIIAGSVTGASGTADGTGTGAAFTSPRGICIDSTNTNLYVAENHRIRKIVIATGVVTTLAGTTSTGSADGTGTGATFSSPHAICIDSTDASLYVADNGNRKIRKIVISSGVVTTFAGSGSVGSANGTGTAATFNSPTGISIDGTGSVYVADANGNLIRRITATGVVTTLAGTGTGASADGNGVLASFNTPFPITINKAGTVAYVGQADSCIRRIDITLLPAISARTLPAPSAGSTAGFVIKYDNTGTALYATSVQGTNTSVTVSSTVTDTASNWYIAGRYTGTPTLASTSTGAITMTAPLNTSAYYVAKYNASGVPQWALKVDGVTGTPLIALDTLQGLVLAGMYSGASPIFYNSSGVVVSSVSTPSSSSPSAFIAKYQADGTPVWCTALQGLGSSGSLKSITIDANNMIYVSGVHTGTQAPISYNSDGSVSQVRLPTPSHTIGTGFIAKYNSSGNTADVFEISSSNAVSVNGVRVSTSGKLACVGSYKSKPVYKDNKGTLVPTIVSPSTTSNNGTLVAQYSPTILSNYNLLSTLPESKNGFQKYITNSGTAATSISVKSGGEDSTSLNITSLNPNSTAVYSWYNGWFKLS